MGTFIGQTPLYTKEAQLVAAEVLLAWPSRLLGVLSNCLPHLCHDFLGALSSWAVSFQLTLLIEPLLFPPPLSMWGVEPASQCPSTHGPSMAWASCRTPSGHLSLPCWLQNGSVMWKAQSRGGQDPIYSHSNLVLFSALTWGKRGMSQPSRAGRQQWWFKKVHKI